MIGGEYKRKAGDGPLILKVVGQKGQKWVCADADTFGAPFEATPHELFLNYHGADGAAVTEVSESDAWALIGSRRLREGNIAAALATKERERTEESSRCWMRASSAAERWTCFSGATRPPTVEPTKMSAQAR